MQVGQQRDGLERAAIYQWLVREIQLSPTEVSRVQADTLGDLDDDNFNESISELMIMKSPLSQHRSAWAERLFTVYDVDESGEIDLSELTTLMLNTDPNVRKVILLCVVECLPFKLGLVGEPSRRRTHDKSSWGDYWCSRSIQLPSVYTMVRLYQH